ncbi:MAG: hypothetical protein ACLRZ9_07720 [Eubacterium sp.]
MNRHFKKVMAVICTIAMVISTITVYNNTAVKADASVSYNGRSYSFSIADKTITGAFLQGIFGTGDDTRLHFAWDGGLVEASSIAATVDDESVSVYGTSAGGAHLRFVDWADSLEIGSHTVKLTATKTGTEEELYGTLNLVITEEEETEPIAGPTDINWDSIEWVGNGSPDATCTNYCKLYAVDGMNFVNFQPYNTANEGIVNHSPTNTSGLGIYMYGAGIVTNVTVNGAATNEYAAETAGAQTWLFPTAFTAVYNTIVITTNANRTYTLYAYVPTYKESEITTPNPTDPDETESATEDEESTSVPSTDEWTTASDTWTTDYVWNIWTNPATGAKYKNADTLDDYYVSIVTGLGQWSVQANTMITGLTSGKVYDYKITVESDVAGAKVGTKEDLTNSALEYKTLEVGSNELTGSFTAGSENAKLFLELGDAANKNVTLHVTGVEVNEHVGELPVEWRGWTSSAGDIYLSDDRSGYTLESSIGADWWSIQTWLTNVVFESGVDYTCAFTITAPAPKQFKVDEQAAGDPALFVESAAGTWKDNGDGTYSYKYVGTYTGTGATKNVRVSYGYFGADDEGFSANDTIKVTISDFQIVSTDQYVPEQPGTTYKVTVDGVEAATVEEGKTYTLGNAKYGYYSDGKMYKAGTDYTVTADVEFTSVTEDNLKVTAANGAGIRLTDPSGIRFQATIEADDTILASDVISEGTIITAKDIYDNNGSTLTLDSAYEKAVIPNSGWYNNQTGTYCGSLVNMTSPNYVREFIAVAYVTVNYADGSATTIYSNMTGARSVQGVAQAIIDKNDLAKFTADQQVLIAGFATVN